MPLLLLVALLGAALAYDIKVKVMMPLAMMDDNGNLQNRDHIEWQLQELKNVDVDGIMVDVWWGIAEPSPQEYVFTGWKDLASICESIGLTMAPVMSFHQCGGNVGDDCNIPIPDWVLSVGDEYGLWYTDQWGNPEREYLSLSADNRDYFYGRTAVEMYEDFMAAFASEFDDEISQGVVDEIQIGLGPCGETRYPSYPSAHWTFPGVGAFQCWDAYMLDDFAAAAASDGHAEWNSPPTDAGGYNSYPWDTSFFESGGFDSAYGEYFLGWYQGALHTHADSVLAAAEAVFGYYDAQLTAKVSGIHWWYGYYSHAAELTAGYYNLYGLSAYEPLANIFKVHGALFDFTCLEMLDSEQDASAYCEPQELVSQVMDDVAAAGGKFSGENALERYDSTGYNTVLSNLRKNPGIVDSFTYLRLSDTLLDGGNLNTFATFVAQVHGI